MNPEAIGPATPVVVDTDVISFIFKNHTLAPAYQAILAGRSLTVSLTTLAEIGYGMEAKNWGTRRRDLMNLGTRLSAPRAALFAVPAMVQILPVLRQISLRATSVLLYEASY